MELNKHYKFLIAFCFFIATLSTSAQQVNTLYFMENVPVRNSLNPAFQPLSKFYFGLPVLGFTQFGVGNNSLSLKDVYFNNASGNPIYITDKTAKVQAALDALKPTTVVGTDFQINLLDFGFKTGRAYWNFSLNQRLNANIGLPKDIFTLLTELNAGKEESKMYDFPTFGFDFTSYTEAGLGYSKQVNDKWAYGVKLKFLYGNANLSFKNSELNYSFDGTTRKIVGQGELNTSSGLLINGNTISMPSSILDLAKPAGIGYGADLGFVYKPTKALNLSAAVTDLGVINWKNNPGNVSYAINYATTSTNLDTINNQIGDKNASLDTYNEGYSTTISPKINLGAEYCFFENKLSLGLLSRTTIYKKIPLQEFTASINGRPIDWFNMSVSYSVMNGRSSNIGAGLGIRTGVLNWFLSADYLPLSYSKTILPSYPIPYNTKAFNLALGVNLVLGNRKDADKDGIVDRKDKCPETPFSVIVDKKGCPVDNDGDGVPDYLDKCPNTPKEAYDKIDMTGCPLDSDNDSVPDYLDKCPDTPIASIGFIDKAGCSLDTDKDGVYDYLDKCANTPQGVVVDSIGCPLDSDGDSVADYLDLCPGTLAQARGMVDKNGCPLDSDSDGVADYLDLCPGTPIEARSFVNKNGCTQDTDGDGVEDYLDKCPDTPKEARGMVDEKGCPRDTDSDGIMDYLDNCPKVPGVVSNKGCPEVKKEVRKLFQKALQGIQFESGKSVIKPASFTILNQIAEVLVANPTYLIEIQGHTDNVGNPASNLVLSDKRAASVRDYLIGKGVTEKRMTSKGFGDSVPVASNKNTAGKAKNRRVEFVVTFEETTFE